MLPAWFPAVVCVAVTFSADAAHTFTDTGATFLFATLRIRRSLAAGASVTSSVRSQHLAQQRDWLAVPLRVPPCTRTTLSLMFLWVYGHDSWSTWDGACAGGCRCFSVHRCGRMGVEICICEAPTMLDGCYVCAACLLLLAVTVFPLWWACYALLLSCHLPPLPCSMAKQTTA